MPATATATEKHPKTANVQPPVEAQAEGTPKQAPTSKRPLTLAAGAVVLIVLLAYGAFYLASPGKAQAPRFAGPFTTELFSDKYQVNLAGAGMKRFLQFTLSVIYEAYDEAAFVQRQRDPLYDPYLQSSVLAVCSTKTVEEVQGRANQDALMEELRAELDPVLFPVFVGGARQALSPDPDSGLRPGFSADRSTFRGAFHDNSLTVDAAQRTLRLNGGPAVPFTGTESDLVVTDELGETLHLDLTGLVDGFSGEVRVGVQGRIRRVLPKYFLVQ